MKGKYAARSALRREDSGVRSEIEGYQHHVKRLTAENERLKAARAAERAEWQQDVRRLKAQLDEGLSPELLALRQELEHQREKANQAVAAYRDIRKKWGNAFTGMQNIYLASHPDATRTDSLDVLMQLCEPELDTGSVAGAGTMPEPARRELGVDAARKIDRARRFTGPNAGREAPSRFDRWREPS